MKRTQKRHKCEPTHALYRWLPPSLFELWRTGRPLRITRNILKNISNAWNFLSRFFQCLENFSERGGFGEARPIYFSKVWKICGALRKSADQIFQGLENRAEHGGLPSSPRLRRDTRRSSPYPKISRSFFWNIRPCISWGSAPRFHLSGKFITTGS